MREEWYNLIQGKCRNERMEKVIRVTLKWVQSEEKKEIERRETRQGEKWSKPDEQQKEKKIEKLAKDEGRQQGVLWTIGNVEQVRRTIGEHGFLEQGQRIMGYGTRHKGHIHSEQRSCGLGSREAENGSPQWVTWPESCGTYLRENTTPYTRAYTHTS